MKCINCEYNNNCSLQEIAIDILGCDGHSKTRELKEDECKCMSCGNIFQNGEIFHLVENPKLGLCFKCY